MDQHSLQDMIDEGPGQRENLRQFIDKLVHEGYTVGDAEGPDPMLVDPGGQIVARADERGGLVSALIDPTLPQTLRQAFPALSDRVFRVGERQ